MPSGVIAANAQRMAEIKRTMEVLKQEYDTLEGFFLALGTEDLSDTKRKSITYIGKDARVTATLAEKTTLVYPSFLRRIFGTAYPDMVKESTSYKLTAEATRLLSGIWTKGFDRTTVANVIRQIPCSDDTRRALEKKLRGINPETDRKNLISIAGLSESEADQYAYFLKEAAIWESFCRLQKVNDRLDEAAIADILDLIDGAVVVEPVPKISVELVDEGKQ